CCNSIGGTIRIAATSMRSNISPTCGTRAEFVISRSPTSTPSVCASSAMAAFCRDHDITLLTYGTVLGGLLSEKYHGRPAPQRSELNTASLQKYSNMIDAWGGWTLFQELLSALKQIADKHQVSIANVGVCYILD